MCRAILWVSLRRLKLMTLLVVGVSATCTVEPTGQLPARGSPMIREETPPLPLGDDSGGVLCAERISINSFAKSFASFAMCGAGHGNEISTKALLAATVFVTPSEGEGKGGGRKNNRSRPNPKRPDD